MLGHSAGLNITALVGAPAHKTGAPLYAGAESIPAPIRCTALIAKLCQRYFYNHLIAASRKGPTIRVVPQHMVGILGIAIAVPSQSKKIMSPACGS